MLWERFIPKSYLSKSNVCGVECVFSEAGISYNYLILTVKKNKVEILKKGNSINEQEILKIAKKNNAPLVINAIGKGIILKAISLSESESSDINQLVKQYLPTINNSDFYVQFYKNDNSTGFLSICRKDQINELVQLFSNQKQIPVALYIGPLAINALAPLNKQLNFLYSSLYQLELTNGFTQKINSVDTDVLKINSIDGITIPPQELISFASAFAYLTQQIPFDSPNDEIMDLSSNHLQKLKLNVLIFALIGFIFFVSALNSVLFFQKFDEHHQLEVELNLYESKNAQITQLLESYQKKKTLIEQAGMFDNKKLSLFADKIGSSLPDEILLRELNFNPETGETEADSLIDFKKNELIIKGNCDKSLILNEWINVLKSQSFIKSVNLQNFIFNSESHIPNFTLEIEIN
jgi:hypothetical protein